MKITVKRERGGPPQVVLEHNDIIIVNTHIQGHDPIALLGRIETETARASAAARVRHITLVSGGESQTGVMVANPIMGTVLLPKATRLTDWLIDAVMGPVGGLSPDEGDDIMVCLEDDRDADATLLRSRATYQQSDDNLDDMVPDMDDEEQPAADRLMGAIEEAAMRNARLAEQQKGNPGH